MFLNKKVKTGGLLVCLGMLSGCMLVPGLRVSASNSGGEKAEPQYRVVEITPQVILSQHLEMGKDASLKELVAADPANAPSEYVVGPGDVLQIVVWDHLELTNPFGAVNRDPVSSGQLVAADGTTYFPYVGTFKAAGKTTQQIRQLVAENLQKVVTKPQVDVRVAAFRSGRIQVTGEVKNPGLVTLDDTTKGLLEAINERGGLNPTASRRTAILVRGDKSYQIDIAGLLSGDRPSVNPLLRPGDIVQVPDAGNDQVFVLGELTKQGPVVMGQQPLTLTEALTKSGGLERTTADDSGVLVFRRPTKLDEPAKIFALDMSRAQGLLLAGEFTLQPRDVVYVKATAFSQYNLVIGQLLPTITAIYQIDALTQ